MKKIEWVKMVSRRHSVFRADFLDGGTAIKVREMWGVNFGNQMFYSSPKLNAWFCDKKCIDELGKFILNKVKSDSKFIEEIALAQEKSCLNLVKVARKMAAGNLKKASNKQLALRLNKYVLAHYDFCGYFDVSNSIKDIGTQKIKDGLVKLLKEEGKIKLINEYIAELVKPAKQPLTNLEQADLARIVPGDKDALAKHARKYEWLSVYNPDQPALSLAYFEERLGDKLGSGTKNKQLKDLAISKELRGLIGLMKKYIYLHTFRAEMLSKSYFLIKPFLTEIALRWKTDLETVCVMTASEIVTDMKKNTLPDFEEIGRREKTYLHLMKNGVVNIYNGEKAKKLFLKELGSDKRRTVVKQIRGLVVSQGLVVGKVRLVIDKKELAHIKNGEILVTTMTSPDYVQAIKNSGAVVTDEGSLLCHAAIICREMGKPCVVGTKIATSVLKTGDLVKVDAYDGIVKIIKK